MTDSVTLAISIGSAVLTVAGVGMIVGRVREKVDTLQKRLDDLEGSTGLGEAGRADVVARLTQVERNTADVGGLKDRMTRLETSTEIHHQATTETLQRLDRGQQGIHRMISNLISAQGGGKLMIMAPSED